MINKSYTSSHGNDQKNGTTNETNSLEKLASDLKKKYPVSNDEILRFLKLRSTQLYLKKIFQEEIKSERHNILRQMFKTGKLNFGIYAPITRLSQIDFLENDNRIDQQLSDILEPILKTWECSHIPSMAISNDEFLHSQAKLYRQKYIFNVMVPESIVKYLQIKNRWDQKRAETFFQDGESRVTNIELEEFDKELEEDAKREKERKIKFQWYETEESDNDTSFDSDNELLDLPNIEECDINGEVATETCISQNPLDNKVKERKRRKISDTGKV